MSIQRKKKICWKCKLPKFIFGRGLFSTCYKREYKPPPKPPRKKRIKPISEKGYRRKLDYKTARIEFLQDHDTCQVALPDCLAPYPTFDKSLLQIHHMQGRQGELLTDKSKFL